MNETPADQKDISGCAIVGIMSQRGRRFGGELVMRAIANMHERSNGLGGGFAGYGIYPEHADEYAFHVMYESGAAKADAEDLLTRRCIIHEAEPIPLRPLDSIRSRPLLYRYFVNLKPEELAANYHLCEEDIVVDLVMSVNTGVSGALIFSSGKNMGIFKGVGYPEQIGDFFRVDEYRAHLWTAHGRFPTNTTGWWGGAHPFGLLDWSVVHNGEISSYGINRRYLMNFGYRCAFHTDTEVITYLFDLLVRKHGLPLRTACMAMAPPLWSSIERMPRAEQELARMVRIVYGGALLNGPFSVLVGHSGGMIAFNDRIKLRPMVAARRGDMVYVASEEAAVREVCREPETIWHARGGEPFVAELKTEPVSQASGR